MSDERARQVGVSVTLGRLAGALAAVLLVTTPLTWWLSGEAGPFVWGKLLLAVIATGFYLATNLDALGRLAGARSTSWLLISVGSVVATVTLLVLMNALAWRNPQHWDVTREGIHTLSEQTLQVLARLDQDVTLYGFFASTEPDFAVVEDALARYGRASERVTVEMVAPESRPDLVERYAVTQNGPRIVVATAQREAKARNASEQEVTNALVQVAERIEKTVAFLQGHGELDFEDRENAEGAAVIRARVDSEGYDTEILSLLAARAVVPGTVIEPDAPPPPVRVPADVKVLVIAGPRARLPGPELLALEEFLARGGRLLVMIEPNSETGLEDFVRPWKVEVRNDFVVDSNPMNRLMGLGAASPQVFATATPHPITDPLVSSAVLITARSIDVASGGEPGVRARPLLRAGDSAWGEVDYAAGAAGFGPDDTQPPVHVAVLATRSTTTVATELAPEGRLLVVGDSDFINNRNHSLQSNADLFLNMVSYLAEEEERITIRPRAREASGILLTGQQMAGLRIVTMDLLPALLVALGFGIVTVRRRR